MAYTIIALSALFFLGHGLKWFFIRTKFPDLLILILIGYVTGPLLGIVQPSDLGKVGPILTTMALIVILYEGGLTLKAKDLLHSSLPALGISVVGFTLITVAGFLIIYLLAFQTWQVALLVALAIGSTSSAIVIPLVKYLTVSEKTKTVLSLESAFTDVLAIVIFLVIVDGIQMGQFSLADLAIGIGPNTLKAILCGIAGGFIWAVMKARMPEVANITFAGEAWAVLNYGVLELMGLNGAMGVLALGFTLANLDLIPLKETSFLDKKPISKENMSLLAEITFLLKTVFFIYLGMLIKFESFQAIAIALIISAAIFTTRYLAVRVLMPKDEYTKMDAMVMTAMGPRGLACAVLATVPLQRGIAGGQWIQDLLFALIPITIFFTALFVIMAENERLRIKLKKFFKSYQEGNAAAATTSVDQRSPSSPRQSNSEEPE